MFPLIWFIYVYGYAPCSRGPRVVRYYQAGELQA